MPPTPTERERESTPRGRRELARSASTNPGGVVDRTRRGHQVPGLDFEDGQADHRSDLQEVVGNGARADPETGMLAGVEHRELGPDEKEPDAGPIWEQIIPERGQPGIPADVAAEATSGE